MSDDSGEDPDYAGGEADSSDTEPGAPNDNDVESDGELCPNPADPGARYLSCGDVNSGQVGRTMQQEYGTGPPPPLRRQPPSVIPPDPADDAADDADEEEEEPQQSERPPPTKKPRLTIQSVFPQEALEGDGGDDYPKPQPDPRPQDAVHSSEKCWLCTFCHNKKAKLLTSFVCANIASMDALHLAAQVKSEIVSTYPHAEGARKRDILRHMREHMLAPQVKIASVLRSLITLAETLRGTLHQRDPETGDVLIDLKSTDMYVKIMTQIRGIYAMDGNKLMFGTNAGGGA